MRNVTISDGQTLLDIAVQELGALEAVFDLADANGLHITDTLAAGQVLVVPESAAQRLELVGYYAARAHRVNTGGGGLATTPPDPEPTNTDFHHPDFHTPDFH